MRDDVLLIRLQFRRRHLRASHPEEVAVLQLVVEVMETVRIQPFARHPQMFHQMMKRLFAALISIRQRIDSEERNQPLVQ